MSNHANASQVSPTLSRHLSEHEDLTWLDFVRTAGGTVSSERPAPPDRQPSADRKRRYTGPEPEGRSYPHPIYSSVAGMSNRRPYPNADAGLAAASNNRDYVDFSTISPNRTHLIQRPTASWMQGTDGSVRSTNGGRRGSDQVIWRRESEVMLPKWQPDSDVSRCPVCEAEFSFWYRKHHCRKCGRVVCAACSPHRITIPRQYIVQPPNPYVDEHDPLNGPDDGSLENPALGGGEVVRVCNPCVPDPWTPGPPTPTQQVPNSSDSTSLTRSSPGLPREGLNLSRAELYRRAANHPSVSSFHNRQRSHSHQATQNYNRSVRVRPRTDMQSMSPENPIPSQQWMLGQGASPVSQSSVRRHTHSSSNVPIPMPAMNLYQHHQGSLPVPGIAPPPAPPRPRREVREEDECPVCGVEMPPGEQVREAHIQDCIATRFSSTPSQQHAAQPSPVAENARSNSALAESGVASASSTPVGSTASRPRATSYRPRGMAVYRASEKDCSTEDGEAQECVICFEEFQPGDEMGRMECLCKFHRACIRQWWETKGQGSCPTHQLHE